MNSAPQAIRAIPPQFSLVRVAPKSCRHSLAALLILLYASLSAVPLVFFVIDPLSKGLGFWWDFAIGLGFGSLGMLALQFVLTARFRMITAPFGIDILYYFHRWAAVTALVLIMGHYAVLRLAYPGSSETAPAIFAPWPNIAGRAALIIYVVIVFTSMFRKKIRFDYDNWRISHGLLAATALLLTILHIEGTGYSSRSVRFGTWAICVFALVALAHIRIVRPWLLSRKKYAVLSVSKENGNAWTVTVAPRGSHRLRFNPGQFAWLSLGLSPFTAREHPFSFSGSAANETTLQFTIKELGDFTRTIKDIKPGTIAFVDGPYGSFSTDFHAASNYVFIAGGVGIAPIMSILRTLADRKDGRALRLIYGNSTWDRVLFREELEALKARLNLTVVHVLGEPPSNWEGEKGIISADLLRRTVREVQPDCVYFVCGPTGLIKTTSRTLRKSGVPLKRIHFEHFEMA